MTANSTRNTHGFALPTILIASVIMFIVLSSTMALLSSISSALDAKYYNQVASEAAQSGIAMAEMCLRESSYQPAWTDAKPLRPNTDCNGDPVNGRDSTVMSTSAIRTTFTVPRPEVASNASLRVSATGTTELLRATNQVVWRTYTQTAAETSRYLDAPQIAGGAGWKDGGHNGYMLASNGTLYGWGDNTSNQLGSSALGTTVTTPVTIAPPDGVTLIRRVFNSGQGASILCVIATHQPQGDQAYCRGMSGFFDATAGWQRVGLPSSLTARDMVVNGYGADSICVLASDQQAYCAGSNDSGYLGNGATSATTVPISAPVRFRLDLANPGPVSGTPSSLTVKKIFNQDRITCVIASDDQAYCAGDNDLGQLGQGNLNHNLWIGNSVPGRAMLPGSPPVVDIRLSYHSTPEGVFFQTQAGDVFMSGQNGRGTANDGAFSGSCPATGAAVNCYPVPRQLTNGTFGKMISIGERGADDRHGVCVLSVSPPPGDGGVWCMGSNSYGQLGSSCADRPNWAMTPMYQNGTGPLQTITYQLNNEANYQMNSLMVITTGGDAYAAGDNTYGKLGTGGIPGPCNFVFKPVQLPSGVHAVAIANSDEYTSFVLSDNGRVYAMGRNNNGQIGDGTTTDRFTPVEVKLPRQQILY